MGETNVARSAIGHSQRARIVLAARVGPAGILRRRTDQHAFDTGGRQGALASRTGS
jgi:hypothetical protein